MLILPARRRILLAELVRLYRPAMLLALEENLAFTRSNPPSGVSAEPAQRAAQLQPSDPRNWAPVHAFRSSSLLLLLIFGTCSCPGRGRNRIRQGNCHVDHFPLDGADDLGDCLSRTPRSLSHAVPLVE